MRTNRIRTLRLMRELSAQDLADAIGVSVSTVYSIETGRINPPQERLELIASFFNCSVSDLMIEQDINPHAGSYLKAVRESRGLTRSEVAEQIGVQTGTVAAIENGRIKLLPNIRVKAYAQALKIRSRNILAKLFVVAATLSIISEPSLAHHEGVGAGKRDMAKAVLSYDDIQELWELPLRKKEKMSMDIIRTAHKHMNGKIHVSHSGGKDSTVGCHITRRIFPDVVAVFADTGLESRTVKEFIKTIDNVITVRPKMSFVRYLEKHGYPLATKKIAKMISQVQRGVLGTGVEAEGKDPTYRMELVLNGIQENGKKASIGYISFKHQYLLGSKSEIERYKKEFAKVGSKAVPPKYDVQVSADCCKVLKKDPLIKWAKENKSLPIISVLAEESQDRLNDIRTRGFNDLDGKNPACMPLGFWTEEDIYAYIKKYSIEIAPDYYERTVKTSCGKTVTVEGEKRTGCQFCMFGFHDEPADNNRLTKMKLVDPVTYKNAMTKYGLAKVVWYIDQHTEPTKKEIKAGVVEGQKWKHLWGEFVTDKGNPKKA